MVKGAAKTDRFEIKCSREVRVGFKKIAAEFDDYEHVLLWLIEHYPYFRTIRSPESVPSAKTKIRHGVL